MKKILCIIMVVLSIIAIFSIKVEKPCGRICGVDGHYYTRYSKEGLFSSSNIYYKNWEGDIIDDSLATAINECRVCSVCRHYITGNYTKFGNDLFCSEECYKAWIRALARELER